MASNEERSRWVVHGERLVYDNRWIRVGLADVQIPDGERFEHHVVHLDRAAIAVVVDEQERVLMMWRHRFVFDRWGWELPGGLIDGDEDALTTAAREVEEETGYRPKEVEHLVTYQPMAGMVDAEHHIVLCRGADLIGAPTGDEVEADLIEWVPMAEIPGMVARGDVWTSGTLIGVYAARERLNAERG
ncbi:NUDIX hydrolase [Spongiactinospora sp. TRM90649]|uniref:NUDIX hydrolase n=1 Tax=Spongiactinospora sp. TRM90649 TaxID=3031114 RepID=UPI0023F6F138|nr:NUDIX hydrolase [Spongiactinospora sp. TRM90649]MDF5753038.1 NUDIX hydrolase [Spongiactinospora sp. TRM90649]